LRDAGYLARADPFRQLERDGNRFHWVETNAFERRSVSTRHGEVERLRKPRQTRATVEFGRGVPVLYRGVRAASAIWIRLRNLTGTLWIIAG
jgi:hypothetical protein